MNQTEMVEILDRDDAELKARLESLDEYCINQIFQEYTKIREVSLNVRLDDFKIENKSFNFSFTVNISILPTGVVDVPGRFMDQDAMVEKLGHHDVGLKKRLELLEEYRINQIFQEYTKIREVSLNVRLNDFKIESKSFDFSFTVSVNTLPYIVDVAGC
ncbi:hypothetical protein [Chitinophaga sp. HK235]|uniref:hypothetical protein n=1 Tax=Chitinophaga sp. HK235 TaxID=2952571 RepID=UPI001BA783F8|nr:hypothetical protein [Chitinophaga sp. HK235]